MSDELYKSILENFSQNDNAGFGGIIVELLNKVMKYERSEALRAQPYERSDSRLGHANGFKNKTMRTTMGATSFNHSEKKKLSGRIILQKKMYIIVPSGNWCPTMMNN